MSFNFHAIVIGLFLLLTTAAGSLMHRETLVTAPTPRSWNSTSVPLGAVPSASTTITRTKIEQSTFKIGDVLPTFTFASDSDHATTSDSPSPLSTLHTYLNNSSAQKAAPVAPSGTFDAGTAIQQLFQNKPQQNVSEDTSGTDALHAYGNAAGAVIRNLDTADKDQNQALSSFFTNPNATTAAPVTAIAANLNAAASGLRALSAPSSDAAALNEKLAAAYADAGNELAALATARPGSDLLNHLDTYQKSVDDLGVAYVGLVRFFAEQKVQFANTDAGSVFVFGGTL